MKNEIELTAEIEKQLRNSDWEFKQNLVIGTARPDFVVTTAKGDQLIIEAKAWDPSPENVKRALDQAQTYKQLSKAAAVMIVTPEGKTISTEHGNVVPVGKFLSTLSSLADELEQSRKKTKAAETSKAPKKTVFASMPFSALYDDTFLVAIEPAALANGAIAERVDHSGVTGDVVEQIKAMIRSSKLMIADLSGSRPNVLHELGFAQALGKSIIQITSSPTAELPFNVRNNQTISYAIGQATRLKKRLEPEVKKNI